jgi:hypothetical protein
MMKLTPALKKSITKDWGALVPQFKAYKPMWLARRIGPLVQGICLDRNSSNSDYRPTLHVHCLCSPFSFLSLSLEQYSRTVRTNAVRTISVQFHENNYREACERLLATSLLPVNGDWTISQVIAAYAAHGRPMGSDPFPVSLMKDAVSLLAWLNEPEKAHALAARYIAEARSWPDYVLTRDGGPIGFESTLSEIADSGEQHRQTVREQIEVLKLQDLPVSQLLNE